MLALRHARCQRTRPSERRAPCWACTVSSGRGESSWRGAANVHECHRTESRQNTCDSLVGAPKHAPKHAPKAEAERRVARHLTCSLRSSHVLLCERLRHMRRGEQTRADAVMRCMVPILVTGFLSECDGRPCPITWRLLLLLSHDNFLHRGHHNRNLRFFSSTTHPIPVDHPPPTVLKSGGRRERGSYWGPSRGCHLWGSAAWIRARTRAPLVTASAAASIATAMGPRWSRSGRACATDRAVGARAGHGGRVATPPCAAVAGALLWHAVASALLWQVCTHRLEKNAVLTMPMLHDG